MRKCESVCVSTCRRTEAPAHVIHTIILRQERRRRANARGGTRRREGAHAPQRRGHPAAGRRKWVPPRPDARTHSHSSTHRRSQHRRKSRQADKEHAQKNKQHPPPGSQLTLAACATFTRSSFKAHTGSMRESTAGESAQRGQPTTESDGHAGSEQRRTTRQRPRCPYKDSL